jgi:hypothetical protein
MQCVVVLVFGTGCGRVGVDLLADESVRSPVTGEDAAEPEPDDDAASEDDAAPGEDGGDEPDVQADAGSDAGRAFDGSSADAATLDAAPFDAASRDASPSDASNNEAAVDATPLPACQLSAGGTTVNYALGEAARLSGTHMLSLTQSGLCVAPSGCGVAASQDVLQTSCSVTTCQMWESSDAGQGYYYLRNAKSGLCLFVADAADGTRLIDNECAADDRLRFQLVCAGNNSWRLVNRLSRLPLQASGTSANATVVQSSQADNAAQRWAISSNASAYTVVMANAENDANAVWRYTTGAPGGSWMQTGFDDASWSSGPGGFGSAARSFTPARTAWTERDIWLRRNFNLSSIPANLTIKIFHDEAAELYVNGNFVAQLSDGSSGYEAVNLSAALLATLVVGSNLITVHTESLNAPQFVDVGLLSYSWR